MIDRLEKAGSARRRHDSQDRRLVLVATTSLAAKRERQLFGELIAATAGLVSSYSDSELAVIADYLDRVGQIVAEHCDRLAQTEPIGVPGSRD